jgi:hypothetical protein
MFPYCPETTSLKSAIAQAWAAPADASLVWTWLAEWRGIQEALRPPVPTSPEALYPMLSHGADAPRELWSRQADVLRAYNRLEDKSAQFPADVAVESPTGPARPWSAA